VVRARADGKPCPRHGLTLGNPLPDGLHVGAHLLLFVAVLTPRGLAAKDRAQQSAFRKKVVGDREEVEEGLGVGGQGVSGSRVEGWGSRQSKPYRERKREG